MGKKDRHPGVGYVGVGGSGLTRAEKNEVVAADARREAFIEATAERMYDSDTTPLDDMSRPREMILEITRNWLRTVWHEARGEEWGS